MKTASFVCVGVVLLSLPVSAQTHSGSPQFATPYSPTGGGYAGMLLAQGGAQIDTIVDQANRSGECKQVQQKGGTDEVPVDFLKGMGYSLVRTLCGREASGSFGGSSTASETVKGLMIAPAGTYSKKDVLASGHYRSGIDMRAGPRNASHTYAIIAALVMQESDANIVEGEDSSKGSQLKTSVAEETGAFQVSADSQNLLDKGAFQELLNSYVSALKAASSNMTTLEEVCRVAKFTGNGQENGKKPVDPNELLLRAQKAITGVSPTETRLSDEAFQEINKTCPAFATEYAALVARANLGHNGPLVRGEVKPSEGCIQMFSKISELSENSSVCQSVGLSKAP